MSGTAAGEAAAPAVEAKGVVRRYGTFVALGGVDLTVGAGTTLALFGPNGAGKTTLLRILAQVLRPSAGEVRIFGLSAGCYPERVLGSLGFLCHEVALYLDLTPAENLAFIARLYGLAAPKQRAREVLERVGLGGRDVPVRALSRGLQQRAALARTLVHAPRLLLLDEPWTGLDPAAQRVLLGELAQHRARGGSAVFTSHDLRRGHESADRVALLAGGRLRFEAASAELTLAELEREYERSAREAA